MSNLEVCANEIINELKQYDNLTEDEIIRFIYLFLGKKISFSIKWGFSFLETKEDIYRYSGNEYSVEDKISNHNWEMICRDTAFLVSYVGKKLGLNIEIVQPRRPSRYDTTPHVYNKVIRKDGSSYCIDLDSDLYCIAMNMRTNYFGFTDNYKSVFSRKQLEEMDYKFGYITKQKTYTDEYFYTLLNYVSCLDSIHDVFDFLLENPSPYYSLDAKFQERKMYILSLINFYRSKCKPSKEIDWEWLDFYYKEGSNIIPKEIIYVKDESGMSLYEFNSENGNYNQISEKELAEMLSNGLHFSDVYQYEHYNAYNRYRWIDNLKNKYSNTI